MESALELYLCRCFKNEEQRNAVRQKLEDNSYEDLDMIKLMDDYELTECGFKQGHIKLLRSKDNEAKTGIKDTQEQDKTKVSQQYQAETTFQPQEGNRPLPFSKFLNKLNGLDIYQYPSQKFNAIEESQARVLMVVGQTGSGKTTLLNYFINYLMGIKFQDPFRYVVIVENTGKSQAFSQTDDVSVYYIKGHNNNPPIKLVDTPGFGDTRGIAQDRKVSLQIKEFFTNKIDSVNAICFVAQASNARLTINQTYIFSQILEMYGKDVAENFVCMLTFCDGGLPQVVTALTDSTSIFSDLIPQIKDPWYLKFNSSALFESNQNATPFTKMFWDIGMESFSQFVNQKLHKLPRKSLTQTKEVLEEREKLEKTIGNLQPQLKQGLQMMDSQRDLLVQIKAKENEIEHTKNFKIKTTIPVITKIDLQPGQYTTNCLTCNFTCHFPCRYADDADKIRCISMKDGNCICCPLKCEWGDHKNMPYRFECKMEETFVEAKDLKKQYMNASSSKSAAAQILEGIERHLFALAEDCLVKQNIIIECINRLKTIALKAGCFETQEEYIDLMIISEKQEHLPGYQGRIRALEELKQKWKLIREAFNKQGTFKDIEQYIKSKETKDLMKNSTNCSIF